MIVWTPEMDALLGTMPDAALAKKWRVSHHSVWMRRKLLGKPPCRKHIDTPLVPIDGKAVSLPRCLTKARVALLGTDYDAALADRWALSMTTVRNARIALDIPSYRDTVAELRDKDLSEILVTLPPVQAARKLGISKQRVYQLIDRLGLHGKSNRYINWAGTTRRGVYVISASKENGFQLRCKCGKEFHLDEWPRKGGPIKCGQCPDRLEGRKFGRLTFIKRLPEEGRSMALWQCDCGNKHKAIIYNVKRASRPDAKGYCASCGCLLRDYWDRNIDGVWFEKGRVSPPPDCATTPVGEQSATEGPGSPSQ